MKPPAVRHRWILAFVDALPAGGVDVLNAAFVDEFAEATGAPLQLRAWGAHRCDRLAADLLALYRSGQLDRFVIPLGGARQPGFPNWVWSYCRPRTF